MCWETLVLDDKLEINTEYPHKIRTKKTKRELKEQTKGDYIEVYIAGKKYRKHRVIALQFIPNPEQKPCIDHINRDKHDNHIDNLRWATYRDNQLNKEKYKRVNEDVYIKELPEKCFVIEHYSGHDFNKYWFDYEHEHIIASMKNKYKILCLTLNNGLYKFDLRDVNGKKCGFRWKKFLNEMRSRISA